MRLLPQSSRRRIAVRVSSLTVLSIFFAMIVPHAQGASGQLQLSGSAVQFGVVVVGQSQTQVVTVDNIGKASVTVSAISVSAPEFSLTTPKLPLLLGAGKSFSFTASFAPTATGWFGNYVTVTSNASNPTLRIPIAGDGVNSDPLTSTPSSLRFGKVKVGGTATLPAVLTNVGSKNITLKAFLVEGNGFTVSGPTLPATLAPGQTANLSITFAPKATGRNGGSVLVSGAGLSIPVSGYGTPQGQLSVSPTALNFGSVNLGSTSTLSATLTAVGASVTVSSATSSNSQFTVSGVTFPLTLSSGQSATLNLVFTPTKAGPDSALLTVASNASDSQATESLTGTGVNPQYSVLLTWDASTSPVVGYNLYRGPAIGVYSKINTSLDPGTQYTDTTVVSGAKYYYAATAVNSSGEESTFSMPIEVIVP